MAFLNRADLWRECHRSAGAANQPWLAALGLVGGVGRLDLFADALPVGVAVGHHVRERAVAHDAHGAVDRDDLAVDVLDLLAHQERRHVGEFVRAADAAHRVARLVAVVVIVLHRIEASPGALGREGARRDGVETDAVACPFDGEALGHHGDAGLRHGRRHDEGAAGPHPGRQDAEYARLALLGDPALAAGVGHVERAVQHDVGDGVEGAGAEVLGLRDEVAGGIVDQTVERPAGPDLIDHLLDGGGDADVDGMEVDPAAGILLHDLLGRLFEDAAAPAADHTVCAQLDELLHHHAAEARAAAGDEESLALEQVGL